MLQFKTVKINRPEGSNVIIGMSHFIKSVEDLYEALIESSTEIKFGLAFCEASGECLVRSEGNSPKLKKLAAENALSIGAGHSFIILLEQAFPINVLNAVKAVSEVCSLFCASANPLEVVLAQGQSGRAILGVIDGASPRAIEGEKDIQWRKDLLRKIGYKR